MNEEKVHEATEKLYSINANISLYCIGLGRKLKEKDVVELNRELGEIIKTLREAMK